MDFRILGPLEVREDGRLVPIPGSKQRALLAVLLLDANRVVSSDRLLEALWGADPPGSGLKALQVYVSQLRKALEPRRAAGAPPQLLRTRPPGYVVEINAEQLDLDSFERFLAEGKRVLADDPARAADILREALSLWRGEALAEFASEPFAPAEIARLEDMRLAALENRIEADLALGRHAGLVGELEALAARYPFRERLRAQLMLALYRSGRQAEGLAVYQETRRRLIDELGIEPGRALQRLEQSILRQEASLDLTEEAEPASPLSSLTRPVEQPGRTEGSALTEERKLVTVLFADLTGSTALGEQLDPERLRALLSEYFAAMAAVIEARGGRVEKYVGDAIMAVFGVPVTREDDTERALAVALEMQDRLDALNPQLAARHGVELTMRIGVNTGEAIAAPEGEQLMVTGDVVNVAARLQQAAPPGAVVAGERTYLGARTAYAFERIADSRPKGKAVPVTSWRVLGRSEPAGRRPSLSTRLVGRERELALLETLYRASAEESRPRLVVIVGQAGIGKTRLTEEFLARVAQSEPRPAVHSGRCLSYGEGITYWALQEILWKAADIRLDDPAPTAAAKLRSFGADVLARAELDSAEADRVTFALATTAGIRLPDNPLEELSPESIGEELGLAWPRLLSALATAGPTLVVVEDLHWAEPPLLDMLEQLVSRSTGRLLIVTTARPEFAEARPGWSSGMGISQVSLEPLTEREARELVEALLPRVGETLRSTILSAAEGNPFFAEEIVAHLLDDGVLRQTDEGIEEAGRSGAISIPDSVRALLAARVDGLARREKQALQDAAVVGRAFWPAALESMRPDSSVRDALRALEHKGLVVVRPSSSLAGQTELAFRHALTREVAYQSIPKASRARAHAAVGEWIERLAGDRRDEYLDLLAYHYEAAGRPEDADLAWPADSSRREELRRKALEALLDAGRAAISRFAIEQAVAFGDRALAFARADTERLPALELKARAAHAGVRGENAWAAYMDALELAERLGDQEKAGKMRAHATLFWTRYRGTFRGHEWIERAVEIVQRGLEDVDDRAVTFERGALLVGRAGFRFWDLAEWPADAARRDAERAAEIAEAIDSPELLSYALDTLAFVAGKEGFCLAADIAGRILEGVERIHDRWSAHEPLVTAAVFLAEAGQFEEAAAHAAKAAAEASQLSTHHRLHGAAAQARTLLASGRLREVASATAEVPDILVEEKKATCFYGFAALAAHALAAHEQGEADGARRALDLFDELASVGPDPLGFRFRALEVLRPVRGVEETRRSAEELETPSNSASLVGQRRLLLQCAALAGDPGIGDLAREARELAGKTCAPALGWIADWAEAAAAARGGRSEDALATGRRATESLAAYGERYVAARLLADLAPMLQGPTRAQVADQAVARLEAVGAKASSAQLRAAAGMPAADS